MPKTAVTGWTVCYSGLYSQSATHASIFAACDGPYLMPAGAHVGASNYELLAAAPRADVLTDCGYESPTRNDPHEANGSGWYFSSYHSWVFAPEGLPIERGQRNYYDTEYLGDPNAVGSDKRLCWHGGGGTLVGGRRLGRETQLDGSTDVERFVLESDGVPVVAPTSCFGATPTIPLRGVTTRRARSRARAAKT